MDYSESALGALFVDGHDERLSVYRGWIGEWVMFERREGDLYSHYLYSTVIQTLRFENSKKELKKQTAALSKVHAAVAITA